MLSDRTLLYGEKLCSLTLGIDRLYRSKLVDADKHDGLAVIDMSGGKFAPDGISDYQQAREALAALAREAFALPEPDRRLYYTQACISLDSFCAQNQGQLPDLSTQIGMFLHVNPAPISQSQIDALLAKIHAMLTDMGYSGDVFQQCAKWEEKNKVPTDEVQGVMTELMAEARERTGNILPLPENDYYRCETVRGEPFNARSDYDNRMVVINIDPVLTRPALKHLVCHECYPGHFMQFSLRRIYWEQGRAAADGLLSVVNHSSSSTFEGIADAGIEFIDWIENDDDRVNAVLGELRAALGTATSYQMHTLKLPNEQVEDWLRGYTLVGGEGWIKNRMKFVGSLSRSALIWSYWRGDQGVFDIWRRVQPEERDRFFDYIYTRLHTIQSMSLFH